MTCSVGADLASVYAYDEARTHMVAAAHSPATPAMLDALATLDVLPPRANLAEAEVMRTGRPLPHDGHTPFPDLHQLTDWRSGNVRASDVVARYGGDEFGIIMRGVSCVEAARAAARIRRHLSTIAAADPAVATVRYGVAAFPIDGTRPTDLVAAADRHLYLMRDGV